jgi:hypothetical protein
LSFFLILLINQPICSQKIGFRLGGVFSIGTHVNNIGITSNLFYQDYFYQVNLGVNSLFNLKSYGQRKCFFENRIALGVVLLGGKQEQQINILQDALIHNTRYNYAIGYNYLWYFDKVGTSQRSGGWSVNIKRLTLLFENDIFGGQGKDRFRTGILALQFKQKEYIIHSRLFIWTGETKGSTWNKTAQPNCPNGFRSLKDLPFGKTSAGIVSLGVYYAPYYHKYSNLQSVFSSHVGFDNEQVRHIFQNKISHDLKFLPQSIQRKTPHYPRLDQNGNPVFVKDSIKPTKFFINFNINSNWSN